MFSPRMNVLSMIEREFRCVRVCGGHGIAKLAATQEYLGDCVTW